ncbi:MAG: FixH family protein [Gemmatimonadetes bacterium]|nr:FixH family protein [Gemmatimonadota bacterium]
MRAEAVWPLAIASVLGVTVVANLWLLHAANEPGTGALEPNYYARALAWDSTQVEHSRSVALGWTAGAAFVQPARIGTELIVHLAQRDGAPLSGARVAVVGVHNLESERPSTWALLERSPGEYVAAVSPAHAGRWELRVSASVGQDRFMSVEHAEAPQGAVR